MEDEHRVEVPLGGGVSGVMKLGFQPVNLTAQFQGNMVHSAGRRDGLPCPGHGFSNEWGAGDRLFKCDVITQGIVLGVAFRF